MNHLQNLHNASLWYNYQISSINDVWGSPGDTIDWNYPGQLSSVNRKQVSLLKCGLVNTSWASTRYEILYPAFPQVWPSGIYSDSRWRLCENNLYKYGLDSFTVQSTQTHLEPCLLLPHQSRIILHSLGCKERVRCMNSCMRGCMKVNDTFMWLCYTFHL